MHRMLVAGLTATLALVLAPVATVGAPAPAAARVEASTYAQQARLATNQARAEHGLPALKPNDCLKRYAVRQARAMAAQGAIFHQDLGAVMEACHLDTAGENVASGYRNGTSVVVNGWMESEGHRANILSPSFTIMGIAARQGGHGRWYVAQVFGRKS